ncbi:hypothetical protein C8J56DRAFT_993470 [Mycena floridula]|nr:hypothetical protein C8J56DRAFT_993470 [Mycena floridula]
MQGCVHKLFIRSLPLLFLRFSSMHVSLFPLPCSSKRPGSKMFTPSPRSLLALISPTLSCQDPLEFIQRQRGQTVSTIRYSPF